MTTWSLSQLLAGLHDEIERRLATTRAAFAQSGTKGDASEHVWLELLQTYLPLRYRAEKAHVVDSKGDFLWSGNTDDRQGRLITCEHGTWPVTRTEYDGSNTVIAERRGLSGAAVLREPVVAAIGADA